MRVDELNRLPVTTIDTVAAAVVLTDMVQSWLDARGSRGPLATEACDEQQDHRTTPAQAGIRVRAAIDPWTGASSSREHPAPVRAEGSGAGTGLERECDPGARPGPGTLGTTGRSRGLQDVGGRGLDGPGGSGICAGSVETCPVECGLASPAATVRVYRHIGHRCGRLLQPRRLQRRVVARSQRHHGAS